MFLDTSFACGDHVLGQSGLLTGRLQIFSMKNILLFLILKFVPTQSIYLRKKERELQVKLICRRLIAPWPWIARNFHRPSNIGAKSSWLGARGGGGGGEGGGRIWGVTEWSFIKERSKSEVQTLLSYNYYTTRKIPSVSYIPYAWKRYREWSYPLSMGQY